ncbi:MAG: 2-C-methyl-D-erythritol 4-phosphate cytidylyltransferase [Clostridia bacterium]|nr:2-C-methyl-D-erythritol 4-phosphate cytidylyltransferase [Clostridia bacterium]
MKNSVIIVAAGSGKRMKSAIAKQYIELKGRTILSYTVETFNKSEYIDEIILVTSKDAIDFVREEIVLKYGFNKVKAVVEGGSERQYSVYNGLQAVSADSDVVLIHDGVRPFVADKYIAELESIAMEYGGCVLGVPVKDTIKICDEGGNITDTPDRASLWLAQTPQCFKHDVVMGAYEAAMAEGILGTDDSMLVERMGTKIKMVKGDYNNIKITTPEDLYMGEVILENELKERQKCGRY